MPTPRKAIILAGALSALLMLIVSCTLFVPRAEAKVFFVGDSRTCGIYDAVYETLSEEVAEIDAKRGEAWRAKSGAKYDWLDIVGVPYVDKHVKSGDVVVILSGINDYENVAAYAELANMKAREWKASNISTYYVALCPVDGYRAALSGYWHRNEGVVEFNTQLQELLSPNVHYIDAYTQLENSTSTIDGLHFDKKTARRVYELIYQELNLERPPYPTASDTASIDDADESTYEYDEKESTDEYEGTGEQPADENMDAPSAGIPLWGLVLGSLVLVAMASSIGALIAIRSMRRKFDEIIVIISQKPDYYIVETPIRDSGGKSPFISDSTSMEYEDEPLAPMASSSPNRHPSEDDFPVPDVFEPIDDFEAADEFEPGDEFEPADEFESTSTPTGYAMEIEEDPFDTLPDNKYSMPTYDANATYAADGTSHALEEDLPGMDDGMFQLADNTSDDDGTGFHFESDVESASLSHDIESARAEIRKEAGIDLKQAYEDLFLIPEPHED